MSILCHIVVELVSNNSYYLCVVGIRYLKLRTKLMEFVLSQSAECVRSAFGCTGDMGRVPSVTHASKPSVCC